jgi:hypothetical protein
MRKYSNRFESPKISGCDYILWCLPSIPKTLEYQFSITSRSILLREIGKHNFVVVGLTHPVSWRVAEVVLSPSSPPLPL